jgi:DNA polymerase III sliding clamp (beta) subunit (PCNA family)
MMNFKLSKRQIKAMLNFAAVNDIRYYLKGLNVKQDHRGTILEAANGHVLGRLLVDTEPMPAANVTLSSDDLKQYAKFTGKQADNFIEFTFDKYQAQVTAIDECENSTKIFKPVDATFPDCERVTVDIANAGEKSCSTFNPKYLMAFMKAAKDLGDKNGVPVLYQRGDKSAGVSIDREDFTGTIMPIRTDHAGFVQSSVWFTPMPEKEPHNE